MSDITLGRWKRRTDGRVVYVLKAGVTHITVQTPAPRRHTWDVRRATFLRRYERDTDGND